MSRYSAYSQSKTKKGKEILTILTPMITLLKPIILAFAKSDSVKRLIVDVLKKLVATTDNQLDDQAVEFIETKIFISSK